jgi:hypothetical protein
MQLGDQQVRVCICVCVCVCVSVCLYSLLAYSMLRARVLFCCVILCVPASFYSLTQTSSVCRSTTSCSCLILWSRLTTKVFLCLGWHSLPSPLLTILTGTCVHMCMCMYYHFQTGWYVYISVCICVCEYL